MEVIEGFIRFWRVLLRFFLSFLFILIMLAIPFWEDIMNFGNTIIPLISKGDWNMLQSLASSLLIFFAFALISATGLFLLEIFVVNFGFLLRLLLKGRILKFVRSHSWMSALFLPSSALAQEFYKIYNLDILNYYRLKSFSVVMSQESEGLQNLPHHIQKISEHINSIENHSIIEHIDYYHSVTQEQAKRDRLRDEIRDVYFFIIVVLSSFILIITHNLFPLYIATLSVLALTASVIPIILDKSTRLARYMMLGYLDAFTAGDGASVEDRDAF